jgi:hypothetical protein
MVANPNSTMLLENIPLFWNLKNTLQENIGYLIHHLSFFRRASKYPLFYSLGHLSIFSILFSFFFFFFHE